MKSSAGKRDHVQRIDSIERIMHALRLKRRSFCDPQARLAELDTPRRLENLQKLEELKKHLMNLEKQVMSLSRRVPRDLLRSGESSRSIYATVEINSVGSFARKRQFPTIDRDSRERIHN